MKIPRYIIERDSVAKRAGLKISREFDAGEDGSRCIHTAWYGTRQQFRATSLFGHSYFPKQECRAFCTCLRDACQIKRPRNGRYVATWSNREAAKIAAYPGDRNIEIVWHAPDWYDKHSGVEVIVLCGSELDLVAEGLLQQRRLPEKRNWKEGGSMLSLSWCVMRLPSGAIKYEINRRIERGFEPSYTLERARLLIALANGEHDPAFQRFLDKLPLDGVLAA